MTTINKKRKAPVPSNQLEALHRRFGPIEHRAISSLTRYANNPRKHPEKQLLKLTASIREFGFTMPVLADESGMIIAGEARIEAAQRAGMTEVPVIVAHHWSAAQVRAYRLADNKLAELASWDNDALAIELAAIIEFDETPIEILGWETAEIDLVIDVAGRSSGEHEVDPADEQVEPPLVPTSRLGDTWALGQHRLHCGSSLDSANWRALLGAETAAMMFTDPPYNVPVAGHVCGLGKVSHAEFAMASGEMSKPEFTEFLGEFVAASLPHLRDGAVLDICMDWRHIGELLAATETNDLTVINMCVWNKTNGGMGSLYRSKHELVLVCKKGKAPHVNNVELGRHGRYRTNVWDYAGVNSFGKGRMDDLEDHPTVKPVALVADAIRDVTRPGDIVLDAFMGSGTTILAAERSRRLAFGIEIEPRYVDVAIRRWQAMTGQEAVLLGDGSSFAEITVARSHASAEDANAVTRAPEED